MTETMNRVEEVTSRIVAGLTALPNAFFGTTKFLTGLAGEALSPETGPAAPLTAAASTRLVINGGGQALGGLASGIYAITGNQTAEKVSNMAVAGTTESGLLVWGLTGSAKWGAAVGSLQNGIPTEAAAQAALEAATALTETVAPTLLNAASPCQ
jgi:hypothetical protein